MLIFGQLGTYDDGAHCSHRAMELFCSGREMQLLMSGKKTRPASGENTHVDGTAPRKKQKTHALHEHTRETNETCAPHECTRDTQRKPLRNTDKRIGNERATNARHTKLFTCGIGVLVFFGFCDWPHAQIHWYVQNRSGVKPPDILNRPPPSWSPLDAQAELEHAVNASRQLRGLIQTCRKGARSNPSQSCRICLLKPSSSTPS